LSNDEPAYFESVPLQVRIAVVLTGVVVAIAADRLVGHERLEPILVVGVQPRLVIIDELRAFSVHGSRDHISTLGLTAPLF
jgi:hypothetical protein